MISVELKIQLLVMNWLLAGVARGFGSYFFVLTMDMGLYSFFLSEMIVIMLRVTIIITLVSMKDWTNIKGLKNSENEEITEENSN